MNVAVWKIGNWIPSKFHDGRNCRVALKGLDDNKSYYLNLTDIHTSVINNWTPILKEGNIIDVTLMPGTNNVNKFVPGRLLKSVEKEII